MSWTLKHIAGAASITIPDFLLKELQAIADQHEKTLTEVIKAFFRIGMLAAHAERHKDMALMAVRPSAQVDANPFSEDTISWHAYQILASVPEMSLQQIAQRVMAVKKVSLDGIKSALYAKPKVFERHKLGYFRLAVPGEQ